MATSRHACSYGLATIRRTSPKKGRSASAEIRRWSPFYHVEGLWTSLGLLAKITVTVIDGNPDHIYIREAADLLNRRMATLRKWEQLGVLPDHLLPHRGVRNWRFWTRDQIEGIKEWIRETDRRSGKGLAHYNPTEKELDKAIDHMRRPHSSKRPRLQGISNK